MPTPRARKEPTFWNEIYWFTAMALLGWILAALVLPPRIAKNAQLLRKEREIIANIQDLEHTENVLEGAASAMENDPYYREGLIRD
ncbi:MAG: hypothetical protein O7H41_16685, partial [Planctomycetota bacterium]|nr:hypothetical protein [Planctomycetota bacterium]